MHNFAILSYMKSLSLSKPHMLVMVGVGGSGKTFFAEKFAETFHAPYVNREKIAAITQQESKTVDELLTYQLEELFKTQQSIIIEAAAETRVDRIELTKLARSHGYETLLIWVQIDPISAKGRALKENKNLTADEYDRQLKRFTIPNAMEKYVVISGKHTYASQAKVVLSKLAGPRTEISTHLTPPVRIEEPGRRNITIR